MRQGLDMPGQDTELGRGIRAGDFASDLAEITRLSHTRAYNAGSQDNTSTQAIERHNPWVWSGEGSGSEEGRSRALSLVREQDLGLVLWDPPQPPRSILGMIWHLVQAVTLTVAALDFLINVMLLLGGVR